MTPRDPRRTHRIWIGVWIAIAVVLLVRATSRPETRGVILDHLEFGRRLLAGQDVHGPWKSDPDAPVRPLHAPYPPSFGLLTAPFALVADTLGDRAARFLWALLQLCCLGATAVALRRLCAPRSPPEDDGRWHVLWFVTFLLGLRFVLRDTHGGGGNLVNLGLCTLAFADAERGRPRRAGLWLGLSLATKPTQLWLLPLLLVLGRTRAVASAVVVGAGAVLLTLLLQRFDTAPWLRWLEGSWRLGTQANAFAVPALEFPPFEWMNQSLRMAIARWCGEVPPEYAARVVWGVSPGLGLPEAAVAWITRLVSLGLLAATLVVAARTAAVPRARLWSFAAALVLSALLGPLSWKAHYVVILPAVLLLLHRAVFEGRRWIGWLLAAWAVCCQPGKEIVGDDGTEWLHSIYVVTIWAVVLLGVALRQAVSAAREHGDAARGGERREVVG